MPKQKGPALHPDPGPAPLSRDVVAEALRRAFLAGQELRREDVQKVDELLPLLSEIARVAHRRKKEPFLLVDACSGKSALGVLAAALVLAPVHPGFQVLALEQEARLRERALRAAELLGVAAAVSFVDGDVADAALWPTAPDLVIALHACGAATDAVLDRSIAADARNILVVPCCYAAASTHGRARRSADVTAQPAATRWAGRLPLPRHGLVGRRFAQAIIDAERTLRLEAHGYETEVVEVFSPSISPYNFLWRARRVKEPVRMAEAQALLARLLADEV